MSPVTSSSAPLRGEVWMLNFDPTRGHEQAGTRPALILSVDVFNAGSADLVIVLPITSRSKGIRSHVVVQPPEGGLSVVSYVKCEDVRSVSKERLHRRLGTISTATLAEIEDKLRILLGL
jgi:mRNA interferase MazF